MSSNSHRGLVQWLQTGFSHSSFSRLIKGAITLAALLYIGYRLRAEASTLSTAWQQVDFYTGLSLFAALLLMPLNLGLEARKWQFLLRGFYPDLSFRKAWQAVFSGLATGIFTPNRIGEYAGRVMYLKAGHRWEAALCLLMDRLSQLLITLLMGIISLEGIWQLFPAALGPYREILTPYWWAIRIGLWLATGLLALGLLRPALILPLLPSRLQHPAWQKIRQALEQLSTPGMGRVLGLGLCRNAVFSFQYLILMWGFGYEGGISLALVLIWAVFLVKSIVPAIALSELGVRESIAITLMGGVGISLFTALSSTFILYLVNLILPALIGLLFVYRMRWA